MKVGILTFHSQVNYGGVLQAFALKCALESIGYNVVIVDRWMSKRNETLTGPLHTGTTTSKIKQLIRALHFIGWLGCLVRYERTRRFVQKRLNLTPYHFYDWSGCSDTIKALDCLIVGSDQVWNGEWGKPKPYLLFGAPKMKAIAYAASFGMRAIPEEMKSLYIEGFKNFSAISVREAEGIKLVEDCGATATHVVDPTLLLDPVLWQSCVTNKKKRRFWQGGDAAETQISQIGTDFWAYSRTQGNEIKKCSLDAIIKPSNIMAASCLRTCLGVAMRSRKQTPKSALNLRKSVFQQRSHQPSLVCYFLSEDIDTALPVLEQFAKENKCKVKVLSNGYLRPIPKSFIQLIAHLKWLWQRWRSPVKIDNAAGPQEFVNHFANATWVLSDSFHALMFASIFNKQAAILRPRDPSRQAMFARIEEFVSTSTTGPVIEETIPDALARFSSGEIMSYIPKVIEARRQASLNWLKDAIKNIPQTNIQ